MVCTKIALSNATNWYCFNFGIKVEMGEKSVTLLRHFLDQSSGRQCMLHCLDIVSQLSSKQYKYHDYNSISSKTTVCVSHFHVSWTRLYYVFGRQHYAYGRISDCMFESQSGHIIFLETDHKIMSTGNLNLRFSKKISLQLLAKVLVLLFSQHWITAQQV